MFKVKEGIELFGDTSLKHVTGGYGSVEIDGGATGSYEGYSIGGRAVFMHNNSTATGIYNDVDDEWLFLAYHNGSGYLYYNGTVEFQTHSGYALANNQMRSPIYYDSDNTSYYVNPASTSKLNDIYLEGEIYHNGDTNTYMQFHGSDQWRVVAGGTERIEVNNSDVNALNVTGNIRTSGNIGKSNNYIDFNNTSHYQSFYIYNGYATVESMRMYGNATGSDLHVRGNVIAHSSAFSDKHLKQDIEKITSAVDKVKQLNGYTFKYIRDQKVSAGVIAQEVEKVLPEAVNDTELGLHTDDDGEKYKVVNYNAIHGLLIEAIKEQQKQIEELKALIKQ